MKITLLELILTQPSRENALSDLELISYTKFFEIIFSNLSYLSKLKQPKKSERALNEVSDCVY